MASRPNPIQDLKNDIVSALRSYSNSSADFKVTTKNEEAGTIPYDFFLAKVDPKQVIPRDTKEWEEAQWQMCVLTIYVDCSKIEEHQIIRGTDKPGSINEAIEKVVEEHIKVYDNGNESCPAHYGTDPRLFLIILLPFEIAIGPKSAEAILPPTCSARYKSEFSSGLSDEQMKNMRHRLSLEDENHSSRVKWEEEWTEWRARTARRSTSRNLFSKAIDNLKKLWYKYK
ncbi:hypothetical protein F4776DRAFT_660989 [Hypoxylon sp. NC0597]|nr:hypothetical protein F4776DRAFT_660989 [Hypoxylon sp. NC0597]